jgi:drug/metabolite transporter (DMT)-like permease
VSPNDAALDKGEVPAATTLTGRVRRRATRTAGARNMLLLAALALIWGSSFMFIKVAVRDLAPSTLVLGRVGFAALALAIVVPIALGAQLTASEVRAHWQALVLVGLLNTALPFWLLSWGETRVDSGLASILQASVPIFVAVFAFAFFHEQRVTGSRLVGIAVGFLGVALLVGAQPEAKILGALAIVGMAACYGISGLLTRRHLANCRPQVVALGTTAVAVVALLPVGVAQAPGESPGWKAIASVVFLGLAGTALAYLLFFTIIANAGAAYASLVTYLVPPIALAYGAFFLDERFGAAAFGGLALILGGVALGTGALHPRRLRRALRGPAA